MDDAGEGMGNNKGMFFNIVELVAASVKKPRLYEKTEFLFWDDFHISKSLLDAHLNSENDGASRKLATIEHSVNNLTSSSLLNEGDTVLDLGCGPGLYSNRLSQYGINVTGIDISKRSIEYAQRKAKEQGLKAEYIRTSFFDISYAGVFDCVLQVYGEMCTFRNEERDRLFKIIHKALKNGGLFIFDVSTRELRKREGLKNKWHFFEGGFWDPGKHIVLEQGFDYPECDTWVDQYTVISENGECKTYRMWFHDYSLETITEILNNNGFTVLSMWNDLTGAKYNPGGDWIAIVAQKV
jgi:SAM-dependent methyltransferase